MASSPKAETRSSEKRRLEADQIPSNMSINTKQRSEIELLADIYGKCADSANPDPILALCRARDRFTVILNSPEYISVLYDAERWKASSSCVKTLYLFSEDDAILQKGIGHVIRSSGGRVPFRIFARVLPLSESQQHLFYQQQQHQRQQQKKIGFSSSAVSSSNLVPSLSSLAQRQLEKHWDATLSKSKSRENLNGGNNNLGDIGHQALQLQRFMGGWTQVLFPDDRSPPISRLLVLAFDLGKLDLHERNAFIKQARETVADMIIFERLPNGDEGKQLWHVDEWTNWFKSHSANIVSMVVSSRGDAFGMAVSFDNQDDEDLYRGIVRRRTPEAN